MHRQTLQLKLTRPPHRLCLAFLLNLWKGQPAASGPTGLWAWVEPVHGALRTKSLVHFQDARILTGMQDGHSGRTKPLRHVRNLHALVLFI